MNLTINTNTANAAIGYIMAACEPRSTLPIMKNVLIEPISSEQVRLTATNAEIQLSAIAPCSTDSQEAITIEGKKLADIFKKLPKDVNATLTTTDAKATLKSGRSKFTLNTLPAVEYPEFQRAGDPSTYTMNGALLRDALDKCAVTMARGDVRAYLNGIHLAFKDGSVDVVATDGHRMNLTTLIADGPDSAVILPSAAVKPVSAVLANDDVTLTITANSLSVADASREVTVKLVDGKYPDYRRVLPRDNQMHVEFDRNELLSALGRVELMSNEKYKGVSLVLGGNQCSIQSRNGTEEAEEIVPCGYDGNEYELGCNASYLMDALGCFTSESVVLQFGATGVTPVLIEDDSIQCVVVPMRL